MLFGSLAVVGDGCGEAVAVDVVDSLKTGVDDAEIGTVASEHLAPDCFRLLWGLGDDVSGVVESSSGHPDVRRGCRGGVSDEHVATSGGLTLSPVDGGGVRELDPLRCAGRRAASGSSVDDGWVRLKHGGCRGSARNGQAKISRGTYV